MPVIEITFRYRAQTESYSKIDPVDFFCERTGMDAKHVTCYIRKMSNDYGNQFDCVCNIYVREGMAKDEIKKVLIAAGEMIAEKWKIDQKNTFLMVHPIPPGYLADRGEILDW